VPYAASTAPENDDSTSSSSTTIGRRVESYEDDNEPAEAQIGSTLLKELKHYRQRLMRQSTFRMSGSGKRQINNNKNTNSRRSNNRGNGNDNENDIFRPRRWNEELVTDYEEVEYENDEPTTITAVATAIIVVRYFDNRLLGVTCGRLTSLYERTAQLALHRHLHGRDVPFVERFTFDTTAIRYGGEKKKKNLFALGAGDTELILDVVVQRPEEENEEEDVSSTASTSSQTDIVRNLMSELQFEHMVGSKNERLPRLQNLQADFPTVGDGCSESSISDVILPIYRYPGNYSGTEWPTHPWSKTTLSIKHLVEKALRPLYIQHMNHCVTNLYRNGYDRIDHHSDKDLDLNRSGVIVSVSLGSTRIMEIRDKLYPHDVARVELPPNSMFVLGPYTNARFTHAVLPSERDFSFDVEEGEVAIGEEFSSTCNDDDDDVNCNIERGGRISLTFRDVRTFLDVKTQRLFGQGVSSASPILVGDDGVLSEDSLSKAVEYTRHQEWKDRRSAVTIALGVGAAAGYVASNRSKELTAESDKLGLLRSVSTMVISASALYWYIHHARSTTRRLYEEKDARVFFSKASATGNKY